MSGEESTLEGTRLDGRYVIGAREAEGGFAVVYRGTHLDLGREVAIKVLKLRHGVGAAANAAILSQFVNEAKTIASLRHPSIVQVLDFGTLHLPSGATAPWMALEWIEGDTLAQVFRARAGMPMSPGAVLDLLRPAFQGLAAAHRQSIAHRDIKPSNIMIVPATEDAPQQVKLMDFGVAKVMEDGDAALDDDSRTTSMFASYTKRYAAPEQALARRTGQWTDVHAMGLIAVEALTGEPAYRSADEGEDGTLGLILNPVRPTPARHGMDVGAWEAVLARALHRTPSSRYPNAGEFLAALEGALPNATAARSAVPGTRGAEAARVSRAGGASTAVAAKEAPGSSLPASPPSRTPWIVVAVAVSVSIGAVGFAVTDRAGHRLAPSPATSVPQARPDAAVLARESAAPVPVVQAGAAVVAVAAPMGQEAPAVIRATRPAAPRAQAVAEVVPRVRAVAATGRLMVSVASWGHIYIDGVQRGMTYVAVDLRPGVHHVRVSGGMEEQRTVTIVAGRRESILFGSVD